MIASIILILFVTSLIAIIKTTFFKSNKSPKIKNSDNFIKQNQNNTFEKQSVNDNDMYLPINTLLQNGRYKIEKVLGSGTFGITYLATTKVKIGGQLGNMEATIKVAIKEFFMEAINGRTGTSVTSGNTDGTYDKYKKKFIKEARNMSRMNHPNIVKVSDIFEANNTCYYVMEYCEGGSLDELIKRKGCLSECESLNYIRQIATALKYMHDNKMLHLDLKPGNVVLRENGDAVLIDFGLSKQFDKNGKAETSTNVGLGTPGYAPIEQSNYDGSTFPVTMDVYALGGTWFKMLTGMCPPDASTILNQGFPAYELQNKNVSERSVRCIAKAMQPLYKDRIQDVGEFMKMFGGGETKNEGTVLYENEVYEEKKPEPIPEPAPKPKSKVFLKVLGIVMIALLVGIGSYYGICSIRLNNKLRKTNAMSHVGVDLGLPSGIKWATCNVGADSPEDYGLYFAWGEIRPKGIYCLENSKTFGKSSYDRDIGGDKSLDAASANWGGSWRLPMKVEIEELVNKCTWEWKSQGKKSGYKVTGPNGNSIFLPAAGYRNKSSLIDAGESGYYWSSTPSGSNSDGAYILRFDSERHSVFLDLRCLGQSVRPVSE